MMVEPLDFRALVRHRGQSPDRRLRNRIIIANAITWIVILLLIRLIFF